MPGCPVIYTSLREIAHLLLRRPIFLINGAAPPPPFSYDAAPITMAGCRRDATFSDLFSLTEILRL